MRARKLTILMPFLGTAALMAAAIGGLLISGSARAGSRIKDIVEVEKIQRADCFQLSDIRTVNSDVPCNKRSKVPLS